MKELLTLSTILSAFVEKASRPGVLGLPGRKIEKATRQELAIYFRKIGAEIVGLKLEDRNYGDRATAAHAAGAAISNVLRKNRSLLQDTLRTRMEQAYLTALKLNYQQEAYDDSEPRDEHGMWTSGTYHITTPKGKTFHAERGGPGTHQELIDQHAPELSGPVGLVNKGGTRSYVEGKTLNISIARPEAVKHASKLIDKSGLDSFNIDVQHRSASGVKYSQNALRSASGNRQEAKRFLNEYKNKSGRFVGIKEADDFQLTPPEGPSVIDTIGDLARKAAAWAEENAGELVTGIDQTTQNLVSSAVADGIENQSGVGGIARAIKDIIDGMTTDRAVTIAATEINRAMSAAAFDKFDDLNIEYKQIILSDDACPICEDNAAVDPLPVDEDYPSGDAAPPFHPNCRCAITGARGPDIAEAYSDDEPRDEQGRWTDGGEGMSHEVKIKGEVKHTAQVKAAIAGLPEEHLKKVGKVTISVSDKVESSNTGKVIGGNTKDEGTHQIIKVGKVKGYHPGGVATHEFGHAINNRTGLADKIGPTVKTEFDKLPAHQQYLARHYNLNHSERFAELYNVAYGPKKGGFGMGQKEAEKKFSGSLDAITKELGPRK